MRISFFIALLSVCTSYLQCSETEETLYSKFQRECALLDTGSYSAHGEEYSQELIGDRFFDHLEVILDNYYACSQTEEEEYNPDDEEKNVVESLVTRYIHDWQIKTYRRRHKESLAPLAIVRRNELAFFKIVSVIITRCYETHIMRKADDCERTRLAPKEIKHFCAYHYCVNVFLAFMHTTLYCAESRGEVEHYRALLALFNERVFNLTCQVVNPNPGGTSPDDLLSYLKEKETDFDFTDELEIFSKIEAFSLAKAVPGFSGNETYVVAG